ncbi:MAG: nicotinate-nucleotide diphosphorylase (carboxylating), partial [bacterium]|nr:nicotinate-nucleotide diphosphorylase (carboxylating) [bacterium]
MFKSRTRLVRAALDEDIGQEDVTTNTTVPPNARCLTRLVAKQAGVFSGVELFRTVFDCLEADVTDWGAHADGYRFKKGEELISFCGNTRAVLTGERVALNFIQHLTGVATMAAQFVEAVKDHKSRICDTRKTTPFLRKFEKMAVV